MKNFFFFSKTSFPTNLNQTAYGTEFAISVTQPSSSSQNVITLTAISFDNSPLSGAWSFQNTSNEFQNNLGQAVVIIPLNNSLLPDDNGTFPSTIRVITNVTSTVHIRPNTDPSLPNDSEGTLVFPVSKFGTEYWVNIPSSMDQNEDQAFSIVARTNNTNISITFPNGTIVNSTLNESDVLHFIGKNLSGTHINSIVCNFPIGVYLATKCSQNPSPSCNYKLESTPSTNFYGTQFVYVSPLALSNTNSTGGNNTNGSNNTNPNSTPFSLFSIVALNDDTMVQINNQPITLNAGAPQTISINDSFTFINADDLINVQVTDTYVNQSKVLVNVLSTNNFFNYAQFSSNSSNVTFIGHNLVILAQSSNVQQSQNNNSTGNNSPQITLNNESIPTQEFFTIPSNPDFSAAIITLNETIAYTVNSSFPIAGYHYGLTQDGGLFGSPINFLFNSTNEISLFP
jgi:hypothetical protein